MGVHAHTMTSSLPLLFLPYLMSSAFHLIASTYICAKIFVQKSMYDGMLRSDVGEVDSVPIWLLHDLLFVWMHLSLSPHNM